MYFYATYHYDQLELNPAEIMGEDTKPELQNYTSHTQR